jgi:hypothetical protein
MSEDLHSEAPAYTLALFRQHCRWMRYSPADSASAGYGSPISRVWHMVENPTPCIVSRSLSYLVARIVIPVPPDERLLLPSQSSLLQH